MATVLSSMTQGFDDLFEKMAALPSDKAPSVQAEPDAGIPAGLLDDFNATLFHPEEKEDDSVPERSGNHIFLAGSELDRAGDGASDVILTDEWVRSHCNPVTNMYPFMASGYAEGGIFDPALFGDADATAGCACGHCTTEGAVCSECGTVAEEKDIAGTYAYIDSGDIPVISGRENLLAGCLGINSFSCRDEKTGLIREVQGGMMLKMILRGELYVSTDAVDRNFAGVGNFPTFPDGKVFSTTGNVEGNFITGPDALNYLSRYMDVHMGLMNLALNEEERENVRSGREKYAFEICLFALENRERTEDAFADIDASVMMSLETGKGSDALISEAGRLDIRLPKTEMTISSGGETYQDFFMTGREFSYEMKMKSGETRYIRLSTPRDGEKVGYVFSAEKGLISCTVIDPSVTKDNISALMLMGIEPGMCTVADPVAFLNAAVKASLVSLDASERKIALDRMQSEFADIVSYATARQKGEASEVKWKEQGRILMGALETLEANGITAQSLIRHFIIVTPPSVRPMKRAEHASTVEGRLGPLNMSYISILSLLNGISELKSAGADRDGGSDAYRKMVASLYSEIDTVDAANRELLSGKKGIARSAIGSFYTRDFARGAIIAGPDLGYSEISMPVTLVYSLFRDRIDSKFRQLRSSDESGFWANVDFEEEMKKESPLAVKIVDMAIHGENPDLDPLVSLMRQPILSKNSLKIAKVNVITGNGVVMNPDFLKALNADHDGDVLSFRPITDPGLIRKAHEDMKHQNYSYNNGEMLSVPSNESLLGLYGVTAPGARLHFGHDTVISAVSSFGEDRVSVVSARHVFLAGRGSNPSETGKLKRKGDYLFTDAEGNRVHAGNIGTLEEKDGMFLFVDTVSNPDFITVPAGVAVNVKKGDFVRSGESLTGGGDPLPRTLELEDVLDFSVSRDDDGYPAVNAGIRIDGEADDMRMSYGESVVFEGRNTTPGRISLLFRLGKPFCTQLLTDRDRVDLLGALEYYGRNGQVMDFRTVTEYLADREGFHEVLDAKVQEYLSGMGEAADGKVRGLYAEYLECRKALDGASGDATATEDCTGREIAAADALFRRLLAINVRDMVMMHIPFPDYQITKKTINRYYGEFVKKNPLLGEEALGRFNRDMFRAGFHYADRVPGLTFSSDSVLQLDGFDINEEFRKLGLENGSNESRATAFEKIIQPEIVRKLESKYCGYANNPIAHMIKSGAKGNWQIAASLGVAVGSGRGRDGSVLSVVYSSRSEGVSQLESAQTLIDSARRSEKGSEMGIIGGYDRWMRDLLQDVTITEEDCGTTEGERISIMSEAGGSVATGHVLISPVKDDSGSILLDEGEVLTSDSISLLRTKGISEVEVRTPAHCRCENGICSSCYGTDYHLGPYDTKRIAVGRKIGVDASAAITADISQTSMDKAKQSGPPSRFDPMEKLGTLLRGEDMSLLNQCRASEYQNDRSSPQKVYGRYLDRLLSFVPRGVGRRHLEVVASSMFGVNISSSQRDPGYTVNLRQYNSLKAGGLIPEDAKVRCIYADITTLTRILGSEKALMALGGKEMGKTITETQIMKQGKENRYNREKAGKRRD